MSPGQLGANAVSRLAAIESSPMADEKEAAGSMDLALPAGNFT